MTMTTQQSQSTRRDLFVARVRRITRWLFTVRKVGAALLVLAVVAGIVGYFQAHPGQPFNWSTFWNDFYANFASELAGIAVTVLIIDSLYERRQVEQERERLLRRLRSQDTGMALDALSELRAMGALRDGTLVRANLENAQLPSAQLGRAELRSARMDFADLAEAEMYFADLEHADMSGVNLHKTVLIGANLRRANLVGANLKGTMLRDADLMEAVLEKAKFDPTTLLPDGTFYTDDAGLKRFTDPQHPQFWRSQMRESPAYSRRARGEGKAAKSVAE